MKYKAIIFDLDGTILNTLEDLTDSLNYSLTKYNLPKRSQTEFKSFLGNGIRKLTERGCPVETDISVIDNVYNNFKEYYITHCSVKTHAYDGVEKLLRYLKDSGYKLAVVSNKSDNAVKILCEKYFVDLFDIVKGEISGTPRKPSPESVYEVMEKFDCNKSEIVIVGDSEVDFNTAKNAEIDCVLVDWGFRDRDFLIQIGGQNIVSNIYELKSFIEK